MESTSLNQRTKPLHSLSPKPPTVKMSDIRIQGSLSKFTFDVTTDP